MHPTGPAAPPGGAASVTLVSRDTPLAKAAYALVHAAAPLTAALLFGGERWMDADLVAVAGDAHASDAAAIVGLATLALDGHHMPDAPEIIGVWVAPDRRRRGIGRALAATLAQAAQDYAGRPALLVPVTREGVGLARALAAAQIVTLPDATLPEEWLADLP
jgi:ribosomal protein S18 acetylase RimI-like enzyme